jgi:hypothetical protein
MSDTATQAVDVSTTNQQPSVHTTNDINMQLETNKRTHSEMQVTDVKPVDENTVQPPDEKRIKLDPSITETKPDTTSETTNTETVPTRLTTPTTAPKPTTRAALLSKLKKQATKLDTIIAEAPEPSPPVTTTPVSTNGTTSPRGGKKRGRKPKSAQKPPSPVPSDEEEAGRARQGRQRRPSNRFSGVDTSGGTISDVAMQQCYKLLLVMKNHRWAWPFNQPVDPEKLGIPDYFNIIKKPMDLGSVEKKLLNNEYENIQEFADDVNLVWQNCMTYNQPDSDVVRMAEELKRIFAEKWAKLKSDIETGSFNEPAPKSPVPSEVAKPSPRPTAAASRPQRPKKAPSVQDARQMSWDEKKRLSTNIGALPADKLQRVVDIIQSRAPKASSKANEMEIEIDLDKLDAVTLRTLEKFVKSALSSKKKSSSKKAKPKTAVPSMEGTSSATGTPATSTNTAGSTEDVFTFTGDASEVKAEKKKDIESESSGGSSDESSGTESSSDSDSSDSDSESDADSEKRKLMSILEKDTSAPQALSSQSTNTQGR